MSTFIKIGGAALVIAVAALGISQAGGAGFGGSEEEAVEGVPAQRGPLRISVLERANLKAANSVNLKCELEGRSTILWLIEEGTIVKEGDLVCQLDTSSQLERKVAQEISVQNAEAQFIKAKQNLAIQESQNESDIAKAMQTLEFAKQDKLKYVNGEYPQELQAAEENILLAESDMALKKNEFEWSQKLSEKGFLERTRLDADEFTYETSKVKLEQTRRTKSLLTDYDNPRRLLELDAAIDEAKRELDRVRLQADARIADFNADMRTSEAKFNLEQDELTKLTEQIEKAEMYAPADGMIVYAKEERSRWSGGDPIQEGTEVRERQDIITIPSSQGMMAEVSLHESVLEKVKEGMPCLVSVDALPGRQFTGTVRFKSTLPDSNSWWANPDLRVYRTEISVNETDPALKSGMSCNVEVIVDDIEDALYIPVQSIFLNRGLPVCFVGGDGGPQMREVEIGQDNGKWVEVLAGVEEGEIVLLSSPPGVTLEPAIEEEPGEGPPEMGGGDSGERKKGYDAGKSDWSGRSSEGKPSRSKSSSSGGAGKPPGE